jgi:DNA-binding response OmpR family regulator
LADILIVEDDENLRLGLQDNLEDEGYSVRVAADVQSALELVGRERFRLLILDIMLPDGDGYSLCTRLRDAGLDAAILMLTARSLEDDVVQGFEAGADDYLTKPYRLRELLARVRALLRRRAAPPSGSRELAGFRVDLDARRVSSPDGEEIPLTRTEFDLLAFLLRHRGRALSRHEILDEVWGRELVVDPRTVDNFISSLKKKLGWTRGCGFRIHTVRGVGYRLEAEK